MNQPAAKPQPALNRQQRRAQKKGVKKRADKMNQAQYHAYQARARLWSKGQQLIGRHVGDDFEAEWNFTGFLRVGRKQSIAEYATHAPMRWHVTAHCICINQDGEKYIVSEDAECGQAATPDELTDLRNELRKAARARVNTRHIWDEYFVMTCLG